jgi:predicted acylesterase/phospholipase RssA
MNPGTPSDADIQRLFDTPGDVPAGTFQLGLVLGGTVSAGAYTAGVLDFLVQALDLWTQRRDSGDAVPTHKVELRFVAGTSGGGVNSAILARALEYSFPAVTQTTAADTAAQNPFYNVWVNYLNLSDMLTTSDLDRAGATITSLLNSETIDTAANEAVSFTGGPRMAPRAWVASPLRLFLTLTNLIGMPYRIDFGSMTLADNSAVALEQSYVAHADFARFAAVYSGRTLAPPDIRPDEFVLSFSPTTFSWADFEQYALGTAAFPIGFQPRTLSRPLAHYQYRLNDEPPPGPPPSEGAPPRYWPLIPDWAAIQDWTGNGLPDTYTFTVVDGGVCDNEPIELVRTALAGITGSNPRGGLAANRAVLLVDPFAGSTAMSKPLPPDLLSSATALLSTVLQQLRYDTRDLLLAADPNVFSRFMITAARDGVIGDQALATAGLGAFIGFASPAFRRHDFLLGRKNCQDYLRSFLVLPEKNPLFDGWCTAGRVNLATYQVKNAAGDIFLPIIPLVGEAMDPVLLDPWPAGAFDPTTLAPAIEARFARLLSAEFATGPLSTVLAWLVGKVAGGSVANYALGLMQKALQDWHLDVAAGSPTV